MAYDICSAVLAINPSAEISVNNESFDEITWHGDTTPISKSDIQAKQAELKKEYDDLAYSRNRKSQYPSIEDVTVALAEKAEGDSTMWDEIAKKRADVKKANPKPE